jgi:hypothetical protein
MIATIFAFMRIGSREIATISEFCLALASYIPSILSILTSAFKCKAYPYSTNIDISELLWESEYLISDERSSNHCGNTFSGVTTPTAISGSTYISAIF